MGKGTGFHCKNTFVDIGIGYIQVNERWLSKIWWWIGQTSFNFYPHLSEYQILLQHKTVLGLSIETFIHFVIYKVRKKYN